MLLSGMIRWRLKNYLEANDLSVYRLVQTVEVSPTTVYALARGTHKRVSLEVLDKVLAGLEQLTGKPATLADLLVREPDPEDTTNPPAPKKSWRDLVGALNDPDSLTDIAERHDFYLAQVDAEDHDQMTLQGKR